MKLYAVISVVLCASLLTNADHLHEIRVLTSNCGDCGMAAFFGQLSVKVKYQCFLLFFSADKYGKKYLFNIGYPSISIHRFAVKML